MDNTKFLSAVVDSLYSFSNFASHEDIEAASKLIHNIITDGGDYPENYFDDFRGSGSYKEAYRVGNLCIKFASFGETIENEIRAYDQAVERGVEYIFCPTFFHHIPEDIYIPLSNIEEEHITPSDKRYTPSADTGHGYALVPQHAAYLIIQPIVGILDDLTECNSPTKYEETPLYLRDGSKLSVDEYLVLDAPLEWRQAIIEKYGDEAYRDISWALKRMSIDDLHQGNVGWLGDKPVIIDWLSWNI